MSNYSIGDLDASRDTVIADFAKAEQLNHERFLAGNPLAGEQYIYDNQRKDAAHIIDKFYGSTIRAISITKRTKVGMNGLMTEIARCAATHKDPKFRAHKDNVYMITGMSNRQWETEMRDTIPECFRDNIFHHGKLPQIKAKFAGLKNAVIIIDEIDTGDREGQRLHKVLRDNAILDLEYIVNNNIRFVFVSATITNQLYDLTKWTEKYHYNYTMTIPEQYVGHNDFLNKGLIKEFFPVYSNETVQHWIDTDITGVYGDDFRVHLIRTKECFMPMLSQVCAKNGVGFYGHTTFDRITNPALKAIFETESQTKHIVIAIKGFYRRANLIPNAWKVRIGAVHEWWVPKPSINVQVQGLVGRMTGYWRDQLETKGFKSGPYRTSMKAIEEYESFYQNPDEFYITYVPPRRISFVNTAVIANYYDMTGQQKQSQQIAKFDTKEQMRDFCRKTIKQEMGIKQRRPKLRQPNEEGFVPAHINSEIRVFSCNEIELAKIGGISEETFVLCPCYRDTTDPETLEYWVVYWSK